MASSSEVNVHVEEVVVVTTPDSSDPSPSGEEVKNMLETAALEQAEVDIIEQSLESESSPTTISLSKETVLVKLSEDVDVEADILYQITCGDSKADLVWKKFVCPGINVKCVQFNDHLISPKEFVYLAGKSTLKDWKRAIRLNGTMLRKIMDSGELDFYQHSKLCSNTCRSTKIDLVGTRASLSSQQSTETVPATPSSADVNGSPATFSTEDDSTEWVTAIGEDTMTFWRGLKDVGLLDDIMDDLQKEIEEILKGMHERIQESPLQVKDAALLNNIVQNFGMLDLVKKVLASHKSEMDRCREQYTRSLVAAHVLSPTGIRRNSFMWTNRSSYVVQRSPTSSHLLPSPPTSTHLLPHLYTPLRSSDTFSRVSVSLLHLLHANEGPVTHSGACKTHKDPSGCSASITCKHAEPVLRPQHALLVTFLLFVWLC